MCVPYFYFFYAAFASRSRNAYFVLLGRMEVLVGATRVSFFSSLMLQDK